jgi:hypothetical protein
MQERWPQKELQARGSRDSLPAPPCLWDWLGRWDTNVILEGVGDSLPDAYE